MWVLKFLVFCYYFFCFVEGEEKHKTHGNNSYIFGVSTENCQGHEFINGIPVLYTGQRAKLHVFGNNLSSTSQVGFTTGNDCDYPIGSLIKLSNSYRAEVIFTPPSKHAPLMKTKYYVCLKQVSETVWRHQGTGKHVSLYVSEPLFATWMYIAAIIICYMLSSLMTGLNLGLMSLDSNELQLLRKAGTPKEKKYAEKIIPVRKNGNLLVCSVVISGTLCNAISTVSTELFLSGVYTIILTTIMIVLVCEILPQSFCSAYPLPIGARTIYITKTFMVLTFPVSYPLSKFLDCIIGKELKSYNKQRLRELLKKSHLPTHEEKIISGTLDFSSKKVEDVMTVIDDIFKLPITAVMNFETIAAILASGYSRIPIYVGEKSNIRYVLLTKDLALLDPGDKVPLKDLVHHSKSTCYYVPKETSLDKVLGNFKEIRYHMIFVTDNDNIPVSDRIGSKFQIGLITVVQGTFDKKKVNVVGLVTFEDIIEEIFQMEIVDETDTIFDNRGKKKISHSQTTDIISLLLKPTKANIPSESDKLALYCFLSEVEEFSIKQVSPKVLISLINLDIYYTTSGNKLLQDIVYIWGVPADYFVMILKGQMEVKIGNEGLTFEAESFRYFGTKALRKGGSFTPDYTLQGVKKTLYIKISCSLYNAAVLATRFERFREVPKINSKSEEYSYFTQLIGQDSISTSSKLS